MAFARPTRSTEGREFFALANYKGQLAAFKVNDEDESYVNPRFVKDGPRPTIWADVTIITGPGAGKVFPNADFGGKHVWEALHEYAGQDTLVLGRIIRGDKGGRPYFINDPSEEDEELAEAFLSDDSNLRVVEAEEEDPRDSSTDADDEPLPY